MVEDLFLHYVKEFFFLINIVVRFREVSSVLSARISPCWFSSKSLLLKDPPLYIGRLSCPTLFLIVPKATSFGPLFVLLLWFAQVVTSGPWIVSFFVTRDGH